MPEPERVPNRTIKIPLIIKSSAVSSPEDGESTTADAGGMGGPRAAPGTTSRSAG